jgi:hypothetical protein
MLQTLFSTRTWPTWSFFLFEAKFRIWHPDHSIFAVTQLKLPKFRVSVCNFNHKKRCEKINQSILSSLFITPIQSRLQHPQACKLATNKRSLLQKSSSKTSSIKISLKTSCQKLYSVKLTSFKQKPQNSTQRIQFHWKDWLTDWLTDSLSSFVFKNTNT